LIDFFKQTGRPYLVVGTKSDRIGRNALTKSITALKAAHDVDEVLPVSAEKSTGLKELWSRLEAAQTV
jgi:GTP-binding protein